MTPERLRRIGQLVAAALERPPAERRRFLEETCGDDAKLLRDVEALLGHDTHMGSLVDTPILRTAAADRPGQLAGKRLGAYEVVRLLGAGGMGEVYLAKDTRLRRKVALKLLPPAFADKDERVRRFVQEARAASMLNHPNILTIFEIGQEEATRFIATELVDGLSLRERLGRGPMSARDAVDVGVQIASALAAAHAAGIVHRDIKPENVMLRPDGYVKVLDFGLAKLTEPESASPDSGSGPVSRLETSPGVVLGTVAYMSPEQMRAEELDGRTDIWSLGVVLYEMVAGRRPFEGKTASDVMAAALKTEPAPLGEAAEDVPEELERIVATALEKEREARYQRAEELLADLEGLERNLEFAANIERAPRTERHAAAHVTAAVSEQAHPTQAGSGEGAAAGAGRRRRAVVGAVATVMLAAIATLAYFTYFAAPADAMTSIAVLPFANGSGDPELDYLSDGISESLINDLSQLQGVKVVARGSSFKYRGDVDPRDAARALGVEGILNGRVEQRSGRLVVSVELVDARDNTHVWGERYDRSSEDLLAVQSEISREIAEKLRARLSSEERHQLATRYTDDLEAYTLYLKGRFHWNKYTEDGFRKAIEYFELAIEKGPSYALAYAGVADSYLVLGVEHLPPKDCFPKVRAAALRALELDDSLAEAHVSLGAYFVFYDQNWPRAEQQFLRAIELKPNYADAYHFYGHYLQAVGRVDEAVTVTERGLELDPLSLIINAELGFAHYLARRYDEAIAQYRATLELDPTFAFASWGLGQAYERTGRHEEAIAELTRAVATSGGWPTVVAELGCAYAAAGRRPEAEAVVVELKRRAAREYVDPALIALVYCDLGETDEALEWLERAREDRSSWMAWLAVEPKFDRLRSDPRFVELLRRVALAP